MKVVLQDGIKDCGICALLSVLRHYGGNVSKEYLREETATSKAGVSAYKLVETAKKLGFEANGVEGDLSNINKNNLPCLAHVIINKSYQHFVVLYEINNEKKLVTIMDPARGKRYLSFSEFRLLSSHNYIFLRPLKKLPLISEENVIKKTIIKFIMSKKTYFVFITILTLLYFVFNILTCFFFKYLIEYAYNYSNSYNLYYLVIFFLFIYLFREVTLYLRNILLLKWELLFDREITTKTYRQLILLPYLYYKNRTTGEVISRLKDLSTIKSFLGFAITTLITDICTITIFMIFIFKINKILSAICLIIVSLHFLLNAIIGKFKHTYNNIIKRKEEQLNSFLIESLASVDAIKGLHVEKNTIDRFKIKYNILLNVTYKYLRIGEINSFLKNNLNNFLYLTISSLGIYLVVAKKLNLALLIIYQNILNYLLVAFNNILLMQENYHTYILGIRRIEEMFTIKKEEFSNSCYYDKYDLKGDVVFTRLSFSYGSKILFKDFDLMIKYGEHILLTGATGSGKSTLIKMLMRYIVIPYGVLKVNGIDINHYHLEVLRSRITYVSQQEILFTDTVYNNITMNKDICLEKVDEVCKITSVDEIIKKDKLGYQMMVEENGFNFSGGERARIIVARSLLKKSDIYVFDEVFSAIDITKAKTILKHIFEYLGCKTIIVITHRFANKNLFDRIIEI